MHHSHSKHDGFLPRSKSGSIISTKRRNSHSEDSATPSSLGSIHVNDHSTPSPHGLKKLFRIKKHSHSGLEEGLISSKSITSPRTSLSRRRNSIELPLIMSVKSKDTFKKTDSNNKNRSRFSFEDQSSSTNAQTNQDYDSGGSSKSEVNSVLNLQVSSHQPTTPSKQDSGMSLMSKQKSSTSHVADPVTNSTSVTAAAQEDDENDDSKEGLLSSFLSAAAHRISGIGTTLEEEVEHSRGLGSAKTEQKSRFGEVISSIRNLASDPNVPLEQLMKDNTYGTHMSNLVAANNRLNTAKFNPEVKYIEDNTGGPLDTSITNNILFEPVRESPLNTLGKGNLSLDDFDKVPHANNDLNIHDDNTGTATIDRIMSPNGRSSMDRRMRSPSRPSRRSSGIYPSGLSTKFTESVEDNIGRKRLNRGSRSKKLLTNGPEDSDLTNEKLEDVSPALSRVATNGQSQTRVKTHKIANEKRLSEFHQVFKQVPSSENLIEDYSCALQKEILVQGRLYISESNVCFNSNILGFVTNYVIPFSEIIQIEKKSTAGLFPNAIVIQTLHSKSIFASFLNREATFDMLTNVWNMNIHGNNRGSMIFMDDDGGDDEESVEADLFSEDNSDADSFSEGDVNTMDGGDDGVGGRSSASIKDTDHDSNGQEFNGIPFEGPKTHLPTENKYEKKQGETLITDETIDAPLGVVFSLMFGDDPNFIKKTLEKSKNFDISDIPKFVTTDGVKRRRYQYTKPLSGPVGPKQTKCIINESIENCDFSHSAQIVQSCQSPDVPSGTSFTVKSTILLSWAKNNSTKIVVLTAVEWTAKSWIKGAVEKGSIDGQKESVKVLIAELKARINSPPPRKRGTTVSKKKNRKMRKSESETTLSKLESQPPQEQPPSQSAIGQIFEMVMAMIPIPDFLKAPLLLIILIFVAWLFLHGGHKKDQQFNNLSNITLNGNDYIILPNNFNSKNYLANKLEYDIWEWIDARNGDESKLKSKHGKKSKKNNKIDGHSRQSLEELVKLTQMKLDELRKLLD